MVCTYFWPNLIKAGEMVKFVGAELYGMALNLEKDVVSIVVFGTILKLNPEIK